RSRGADDAGAVDADPRSRVGRADLLAILERRRTMTDTYLKFANSAVGRQVVPRLGLPSPPRLERWRPGRPVVDGAVLLGAAPGGRLGGAILRVLRDVDAEIWTAEGELRDEAAALGLTPKIHATT